MAGQFINPDPLLESSDAPHEQIDIPIHSGYQAIKEAAQFRGHSRIFDSIAGRLAQIDMPYEDQCSIDYYFDLVRVLRDLNGEYERVVEVGVYMGGASSVIAGCAERFDFDLDLVDIRANNLRFSYERIRRAFPEAVGRVRLFHGDVPAYVREVMLKERARRSLLHHDGAHDFNQVVTDLSALSFARESIHAIIAQDTHLRGTLENMNFVDLALNAVFGPDLNYMPIGKVYDANDDRTAPNRYQGNYFLPGIAEGMVLPLHANQFHYPHPSMTFEAMFGEHESAAVEDRAAA
ncbi:MAG: class I SAM-dependent methyltransferase [Pseudomonadota bacterium]